MSARLIISDPRLVAAGTLLRANLGLTVNELFEALLIMRRDVAARDPRTAILLRLALPEQEKKP